MKKTIKQFLLYLNRFLPEPRFYIFRMTEKEKSLFDAHVSKAKGFVEFGSGGSTIRALIKSKANIYSVESSALWIEKLMNYRIIRNAIKKKRLTFIKVDIGKTKKYGFPVSKENSHLFPAYSNEVFGHVDPLAIDCVLIDGRFRVACGLNTIQQLHHNKNLRIIFHDFWNRPHFHKILDYTEIVDKADAMAVLKVKEQIPMKLLQKDYEAYKFNPK